MQRFARPQCAQERECANLRSWEGIAQPAGRREQRAAAGNDIVDERQSELALPAFATAQKVALECEGSVMLERRGTLPRRCESRLSHRVAAPQDGPDLRRQPNLLQAPRQALAHPVRALLGSTARNGHQYNAIAKCRSKASVTYRLQPDPGDEMWQPGCACGL